MLHVTLVPCGMSLLFPVPSVVQARDWLRANFPYWDRRGGRDHIWYMSHDEGACYAPTDIFNVSGGGGGWGDDEGARYAPTGIVNVRRRGGGDEGVPCAPTCMLNVSVVRFYPL